MTTTRGARNLFSKEKNDVDLLIKYCIDDFAEDVLETIQSPGYCPVDKGALRDGHYIIGEGNVRYICSEEEYWKYVVGGHYSLTTERQRAWWFWYLEEVLGGQYQRKTDGPTGYVPPDNYPERALDHVIKSNMIDAHGKARISQFIG